MDRPYDVNVAGAGSAGCVLAARLSVDLDAVHRGIASHSVDASIMTDIPRANTNLPTTMVAEKIAAWLTGRQPADLLTDTTLRTR